MQKGSFFLKGFLSCLHPKCGLNIETAICFVDDKIYFGTFGNIVTLPVFHGDGHTAHIYLIPKYAQLVVDEVFHDMCLFKLSESCNSIPYSDVLKVVFDGASYVPSFLYIKTTRLRYKEGIFQIGDVGIDGAFGYCLAGIAMECMHEISTAGKEQSQNNLIIL